MKRLTKNLAALFICFLVFTNLQIYAQLKSPNNQADYIIIYHPDFQNELTDFIQWRQSKGLTVFPVNVNDVYDEFNDTASQQESIRDFISYTLNNWQDPKPQYLLLVGSILHIPSYRIESDLNFPPLNEDSVSIDEYFVTDKYDSDGLMDMCIGRFPARTIEDLNNMFNKTIQFEDHFNEIEYKYDFLALADSSDQGIFNYSIENLINKSLPKNYNIKRIYFQDTSQYKSTKEDFFSALYDGTAIMCFYGHGNPNVWIKPGIFTINDFDSLKLSNKPFFHSSATSSQAFDNPEKKCIIETLITYNNGGAVATLAPTGLTYVGIIERFNEGFYKTIVNDKNLTIGKAIMETKKNSFYSNSNDLKRYSLLGDPALKFPEKLIAGLKDIQIPSSAFNMSAFPNPFLNKLNISFSLSVDNDVELLVYDIKGKLISKKSFSKLEAGLHNVEFNFDAISSGEYNCVLKIGNEIEIKKIVCVK
ncbi:MAG: C25 family cysteine peptidase [Bacteroidetes bacterium]|nr:C25 family cysteine peptidase [Bacteroidota bacterium]